MANPPGLTASTLRRLLTEDRLRINEARLRRLEDLEANTSLLSTNAQMWRSLLGEEPPDAMLHAALDFTGYEAAS